MSSRIRLSGVTVNAPDALSLALFYAAITGGSARGDSHWAAVVGVDGFIAFQQVESFERPSWPSGSVSLHLDFHVDDLEAASARVLAAGAVLLEEQPNSDHCYVFADPAGHPFCLSTWYGPELALGR